MLMGESARRSSTRALEAESMNKFFEAVANVFRIPDLRNRVLFTLGMLAIYRLGGAHSDARYRRAAV